MTDKKIGISGNSDKMHVFKVFGGALLFLVAVAYTALIGMPSLEVEVNKIKSNTKNFEAMLVVAEDIEDNPEKIAFVAFTSRAVEDKYMDRGERHKAMRLYLSMLKTIELPECMHRLLKKTVGSWLREDWLNAMQKRLDDKPCDIK